MTVYKQNILDINIVALGNRRTNGDHLVSYFPEVINSRAISTDTILIKYPNRVYK